MHAQVDVGGGVFGFLSSSSTAALAAVLPADEALEEPAARPPAGRRLCCGFCCGQSAIRWSVLLQL